MKYLNSVNVEITKNIAHELGKAFIWGSSDEGHNYWNQVQSRLFNIAKQKEAESSIALTKECELRVAREAQTQLEQWFIKHGLQIPERR
jgi:hypothetical protein